MGLFPGQQVRNLCFIDPSLGELVVLISWMDLVLGLAVQTAIIPNYN